MPTGFYVALLVAALLIAAGIAIVAVQGSRRESVREREGRRDGYVRDGDEPWLVWDPELERGMSPEDAAMLRQGYIRIDDCPRGRP